jgi:two-component system, OmpR family, response regulator
VSGWRHAINFITPSRESSVRILIVEDDLSMAASLERGLVAEGYIVDVQHDGAAGLQAALDVDYDAIVLDVMLPKRNGFSVVAELRKAELATPVLMLTAKDGEWDQAEALDAGADDYVTKPFSYPVLLARLRALLRRSTSQLSAVLQVGDLRLDVAAHRCWRGEIEIELTPREYELLSYLMHRAGLPVSKIDLVDHVWDVAFDADTNVVEVYIGYLRKKIDAPFGCASIETVRGVGYRLVAP